MPSPINDISLCVQQAHKLSQRLKDAGRRDQALYQAFISLAGNQTIGFMAFVIWRERTRLLSSRR
ncbi:MAG: hypothetical protein GY792_31320 [Gammaproteobacteria bacterium]|nr:hypothetical protein [Gammaproteobacteria bacterium]